MRLYYYILSTGAPFAVQTIADMQTATSIRSAIKYKGLLAPDRPPTEWRKHLRILTAQRDRLTALAQAMPMAQTIQDDRVDAEVRLRTHAAQHPAAAQDYEARLRVASLCDRAVLELRTGGRVQDVQAILDDAARMHAQLPQYPLCPIQEPIRMQARIDKQMTTPPPPLTRLEYDKLRYTYERIAGTENAVRNKLTGRTHKTHVYVQGSKSVPTRYVVMMLDYVPTPEAPFPDNVEPKLDADLSAYRLIDGEVFVRLEASTVKVEGEAIPVDLLTTYLGEQQ